MNIKAGFTAESSSVQVEGSVQHVITDKEVVSFGISDQNLKKAIEQYFGKAPKGAALHTPTPSDDLYRTYGWPEVNTVLSAISAEILQITSNPVIVDQKTSTNYLNKMISVNTAMSTSVEQTASTEWSETSSIEISQSITYGLDFMGTGVTGTTSLTFNQQWGHGGSQSKAITIGTTHGTTFDVDPGESVSVKLTASMGSMKIRIVYEARLTGCTAINYQRKYKDHNFWCLDINEVMRAGGITNAIRFTEDIEVGYYGNSEIIVEAGKTKTRRRSYVDTGRMTVFITL